jgi:hypothetical protein
MNKTEQVIKTSQLVLMILESDEGINKYLEKANLSINDEKKQSISRILGALSNGVDEQSPLNDIIETLSDVMEDGKFKLNEMIVLMNVLVKHVKDIDLSEIEIENEDFATLLKLIIIVLDETNVVEMGEDTDFIFTSIDTSVFLIDQIKEINVEINDDKSDKSSKSEDDKLVDNKSEDDKLEDNKSEDNKSEDNKSEDNKSEDNKRFKINFFCLKFSF